ncbi:MAG: hypothetical protein WC836_05400 [Desulfobacula sp.]|jgi:hypothetical protein
MRLYFSICVKLSVCLIFVSVFTSAALCDSSPGSPPLERWTGKITGMAEGTWILNAWRAENTENELIIKGNLDMTLNSISGGYGRGNCYGTITGKIKDGILKADFLGRGMIIEGEGSVFGGMNGVLYENKGNGAYSFISPIGNHTGEWTLQKGE